MSETHDQPKAAGSAFWNSNPCGGRWAHYSEFQAWYRQTEPYAFSILDKFDWRGQTVLDAGCGQGIFANYLSSLGATVCGIDMSLQSLRSAAQGAAQLGVAERTSVCGADVETLPFLADSFDTVCCLGVLHHTPNTEVGIRELWRVLKPGGLAMIMLYHSGNPKWWATRLLRGVSSLVDRVTGQPYTLANRLRPKHGEGDKRGTALLELFGCPVLKAYSNPAARRMLHMFSEVTIYNQNPGFRRLKDIVPGLRLFGSALGLLDRCTESTWGFYQFLEARK